MILKEPFKTFPSHGVTVFFSAVDEWLNKPVDRAETEQDGTPETLTVIGEAIKLFLVILVVNLQNSLFPIQVVFNRI